jgi:trehalose/maltose hydrolase-like predicted phosphorylase
MAGTLDLVQRGLTGLQPHGDCLGLDPVPLPQLSRFRLALRYRSHWGVDLALHGGRLSVGVPDSGQEPMPVAVGGRTYQVAPGTEVTVELPG